MVVVDMINIYVSKFKCKNCLDKVAVTHIVELIIYITY